MAEAAQTVKKVALELGGKNPNIVFADADFDTAVDMALTAVFLHSGQVVLGRCPADRAGLASRPVHRRPRRRGPVDRLGGPFDPTPRPAR